MKRTTLLTILLLFTLLLAACGGTDQTSSEAEEVAAPTVETTEIETEAEGVAEKEMSNTIVDIAVNDGRFNTLVTAVTAAGLAETLAGEGPFTVFAPTDEAFAALPEGTIENLLEDPEGALTDVLLYHVVEGAVPTETVVGLESATGICYNRWW